MKENGERSDLLAGYAYEAGVAGCETPGACWVTAGHPGIMEAMLARPRLVFSRRGPETEMPLPNRPYASGRKSDAMLMLSIR